jgi:hypothetical protein
MKICDKFRWVISSDNKCGCWPLACPVPIDADARYCDGCERHVISERWTQVVRDEVCQQMCHRHFQE